MSESIHHLNLFRKIQFLWLHAYSSFEKFIDKKMSPETQHEKGLNAFLSEGRVRACVRSVS